MTQPTSRTWSDADERARREVRRRLLGRQRPFTMLGITVKEAAASFATLSTAMANCRCVLANMSTAFPFPVDEERGRRKPSDELPTMLPEDAP